MNASLVLTLAAIAAAPIGEDNESAPSVLHQALIVDQAPLIVRGQDAVIEGPALSGPGMTVPAPGNTLYYPPTYGSDPTGGYAPATGGYPTSGTPAPLSGDPWLSGTTGPGAPANFGPYGPSVSGQPIISYGLNGPQPYRLGWTDRFDMAILPKESAALAGVDIGGFKVFEANVDKELLTPVFNNWIFGVDTQFNYRAWEGPNVIPLPGSVYRVGVGLTLASPQYYGWSVELGFNPAIATDFQSGLPGDAWLFDGRAVAFWRWSPQWTWALGAAYWDRVDSMVIPYAGAVWTPNQYWELRMIFPNPRLTAFLGAPMGIPTWAYVSGEYHVEAYAVDLGPTTRRVQVSDWRVMGGLRWESGIYTTFIEAGWVLDREIEVDAGPEAGISDGFIGRLGVRF